MQQSAVSIRPEHLPDFEQPPLNEVVLGVQFKTPREYSQIKAYEVWQLFRDDYPNVQEHQALQPSFETFGPNLAAPSQMNFGFITGASHDRYWFVSEDGANLIQFQHDRLLHNWRKVANQENEYPRYEAMRDMFLNEMNDLERYFSQLGSPRLDISQCEVSYINHLPDGAPDTWLKFLRFDEGSVPESFATLFKEVMFNADRRPVGRLTCEAQTVQKPTGQRITVFNLTVKGAPFRNDIGGAIDFLNLAREKIVCRFSELTTDQAHSVWKRFK